MKTGIKTIVAILICTVPGVAAADPIVFENAYTNGEQIQDSTLLCSACDTMYRVWDNFTLSEATEITQIDARVYFNGHPSPTSLEYSVWTPDRKERLFAQVLTVGQLVVNPLSSYTDSDLFALITGLQLSAGEYALSIWNMALSGSYFAWHATTISKNSGYAYQSIDGSGEAGSSYNMQLAFRLHGNAVAVPVTVPEPGTIALLGLGLAGIGFSRRRKA